MHSDTASRDELTTTFRALSQKRRQGVLAIASGDAVYQVTFCNGKIVEVERSGEEKAREILQKLICSGNLPAKLWTLLSENVHTVQELYDETVNKGLLDHKQFLRAKQTIEMNLLYLLRGLSAAKYEFTPKIIHPGLLSGISISAGQLLLDMVELDTEESRFAALFAGEDGLEAVIVAEQTEEAALTTAEGEAMQALDVLTGCLEDIRERTLLTEYELRRALLSLYDQQRIHVDYEERTKHEQIDSKSLIDDAAGYLADIDENGDEDRAVAQAFAYEEQSQAVQNHAKVESFANEPQSAAVSSTPEVESEFEAVELQGSASDGILAAIESEEAAAPPRPPQASLLFRINCLLLQPQALSYMSLGMCLIFLTTLAIIGPALFVKWFDALSLFDIKQ